MTNRTKHRIIFYSLLTLFIGVCGFALYENKKLQKQNVSLSDTLIETRDTLFNTETEYASTTQFLSTVIASLEGDLSSTLGENAEKDKQIEGTLAILKGVQGDLENTQEEKQKVEENLEQEKEKVGNFSQQVKEITGVVETLTKLSTTDKELLQKYSKIYFLNEHYTPSDIIPIKSEYLHNKEYALWIHSKVRPFLEQMLADALLQEIPIKVISAFRSYGTQAQLKASYTLVYGSGANTFSADQGYSEHQLGTTVDFTTLLLGPEYESFGESQAFQWLEQNAYKYGFVLSYPEGNGYYVYEPWHWRFVGRNLAEKLHNEGKNFYDLEQREINNYLVSIFD